MLKTIQGLIRYQHYGTSPNAADEIELNVDKGTIFKSETSVN